MCENMLTSSTCETTFSFLLRCWNSFLRDVVVVRLVKMSTLESNEIPFRRASKQIFSVRELPFDGSIWKCVLWSSGIFIRRASMSISSWGIALKNPIIDQFVNDDQKRRRMKPRIGLQWSTNTTSNSREIRPNSLIGRQAPNFTEFFLSTQRSLSWFPRDEDSYLHRRINQGRNAWCWTPLSLVHFIFAFQIE